MPANGIDSETLKNIADTAFRTDLPHAPLSVKEQASRSLFDEACISASNQGKTVYNALAQVGNAAGMDLQMAKLETQNAAPVMSPRWWMQQGGSLAVTVPLILLTHKCVSSVTEPLPARAATAATSAEVSAARNFSLGLAPEKLAMARLGATGAIFEGTFKPSTDSSLAWGRTKQAGEGAISFLAAGLTYSKLGGSLVRGAAESELPAALAPRLVPNIGRLAVAGLGGGGAFGLMHEQTKNIFDTGRPANFSSSIDATARGALTGLVLSPVGMLVPGPAAVTREGTAAEAAAKPALAQVEGSVAPAVNLALNPAVEVAAVRPAVAAKAEAEVVAAPVNVNPNNVMSGLARDPNLSPAARDNMLAEAGKDLSAGAKLARNGQHKEAFDQFNNALTGLVRVRGTEHPSLSGVLSDMARSDMFVGNNARSVESMQTALAINKRAFGEGSPQVAANYDQLSAIYQRGGNYAQAAEALDNSIVSRRSAADSGKLTAPGKLEFETGLRELMGRLANLYEKGGNPTQAAQVRESMPPPPVQEPELH